MTVFVEEPVTVIVSFGGRERLRPLKFRWNGRVIPVKEVTYRWTNVDGDKKFYCFSLTDGTTLYNLSFDPKELQWRLLEVEA